jgi:site-specific DNA recombinase
MATEADTTRSDRSAAKRRLADAEKILSRLRAAIEAGADPEALIESLNKAQQKRAAAKTETAAAKPEPWELTRAEVHAMVDTLGDVGASLTRADPAKTAKIYKGMRLELAYDHGEQALDAVTKPLGGFVRVSEGGLEPPRPLKGTSTSS